MGYPFHWSAAEWANGPIYGTPYQFFLFFSTLVGCTCDTHVLPNKLFIFIKNIIDNTFIFISKIYSCTCNKDVFKK